jgi:hypothetical protein
VIDQTVRYIKSFTVKRNEPKPRTCKGASLLTFGQASLLHNRSHRQKPRRLQDGSRSFWIRSTVATAREPGADRAEEPIEQAERGQTAFDNLYKRAMACKFALQGTSSVNLNELLSKGRDYSQQQYSEYSSIFDQLRRSNQRAQGLTRPSGTGRNWAAVGRPAE